MILNGTVQSRNKPFFKTALILYFVKNYIIIFALVIITIYFIPLRIKSTGIIHFGLYLIKIEALSYNSLWKALK